MNSFLPFLDTFSNIFRWTMETTPLTLWGLMSLTCSSFMPEAFSSASTSSPLLPFISASVWARKLDNRIWNLYTRWNEKEKSVSWFVRMCPLATWRLSTQSNEVKPSQHLSCQWPTLHIFCFLKSLSLILVPWPT